MQYSLRNSRFLEVVYTKVLIEGVVLYLTKKHEHLFFAKKKTALCSLCPQKAMGHVTRRRNA